MESRAKLLGHPIHQMLIVFPLGLLGTSAAFDVAHLVTGTGRWAEIAYYLIAVGVLTGLVAAVFGVIDWAAVPQGTRAKRVGLWHAGANVTAIALFAVSWLMRRGAPEEPGVAAIAIALAGVALAVVGGWLGGELVDRLGIGVDPGAHADAPSSLSGRPASGSVGAAP